MSALMQIQSFIQAYVEAISSILDVEVTIVDNELIRVGGTGEYYAKIGEKVPEDSFFKTILDCGKSGLIKDVHNELACLNCKKQKNCKELANLAYPIFKENMVVGIIALTAFQEKERINLIKLQKKLEEFLKYMSTLLESKLITTELNERLQCQIHEVITIENEQKNKFIGKSLKIEEILKLVHKVASSNSTIMLRGESGTGKEVLAKTIHSLSPYKNRLMVCVNCAAIPENLVESELFGYDEGAFTGAKKHGHIGKFELANNSTIFLDEIGDMPLSVQTKLLRVLQENCIERIGGKSPIPIYVRVICATNRNLEQMVEQKLFREDLYYRLNVIPIEIPPLREHKEDIPLLIDYFIHYYNQKLQKNIIGISEQACNALTDYNWPGNVRELKNIIEYLENVTETKTIQLSDLPDHFLLSKNIAPSQHTLKELLENYEEKILFNLAKQANTVEEKTELAKQLGISRATLYRKLAQYGFD